MILEVIVLSQGKPPGPGNPPLEAAQLVYEGPASAEEGGDQGRSVRPGRSKNFPSLGIRFRWEEQQPEVEDDRRSASVIVEAINRFSRQGPGGTFDLKGFSSLEHCLLCSKNCTCISSCMGPPPRKPTKVSSKFPLPSTIPGLPGGKSLPSISLTTVTKTASRSKPVYVVRCTVSTIANKLVYVQS
jgi:hypothetical protein